MKRNTEADFWAKVEKTDGCWVWKAGKDQDGYGRFRWRGDSIIASRMAWLLTYGEIEPGLFVCHRCDNPPCVRPDHLFLGTAKDNNQDMHRKGRFVPHGKKWTPEQREKTREYYRAHPEARKRGEQLPQAKLTTEKVLEMRRIRRETGRIYSDIAAEFGVTKRAALLAIQGLTWKHVGGAVNPPSANSRARI